MDVTHDEAAQSLKRAMDMDSVRKSFIAKFYSQATCIILLANLFYMYWDPLP